MYDQEERYLKEHFGNDTKLRLKAWKAEDADLTVPKDRLYREVRKLKEATEAETVKRCAEQETPPTEQRKEKSKGQAISL